MSLYNSLEEYMKYILTRVRGIFFDALRDGVTDYGHVMSLVLHRDAPYQTELVICRTGPIVEHKHPGVEQYLIPLAGRMDVTVEGKSVYTRDEIEEWYSSDKRSQRPPIRISGNLVHGGEIIDPAAAFLNIQKWDYGIPMSSIGLRWDGLPDSPEQAALLGRA